MKTANTTSPTSTQLSTSNGTKRPDASFFRSIFIAHSKVAMFMKSELSAEWRPTQILFPKPYVKCPSFLRSDITGATCPLASRYRAGSKCSASLPKISGSWFMCHTFGTQIVPLGINIPSYQSSSMVRCAAASGATGLQRKSSLTMARM